MRWQCDKHGMEPSWLGLASAAAGDGGDGGSDASGDTDDLLAAMSLLGAASTPGPGPGAELSAQGTPGSGAEAGDEGDDDGGR